jgi:hypothetical protein
MRLIPSIFMHGPTTCESFPLLAIVRTLPSVWQNLHTSSLLPSTTSSHIRWRCSKCISYLETALVRANMAMHIECRRRQASLLHAMDHDPPRRRLGSTRALLLVALVFRPANEVREAERWVADREGQDGDDDQTLQQSVLAKVVSKSRQLGYTHNPSNAMKLASSRMSGLPQPPVSSGTR